MNLVDIKSIVIILYYNINKGIKAFTNLGYDIVCTVLWLMSIYSNNLFCNFRVFVWTWEQLPLGNILIISLSSIDGKGLGMA